MEHILGEKCNDQTCVSENKSLVDVLNLIPRRAWKEREPIGGYCI